MLIRKFNNDGHRGVLWDNSKHKWHAQIMVDHKLIDLGHYIFLSEAVDARETAELKYGFHPIHKPGEIPQ